LCKRDGWNGRKEIQQWQAYREYVSHTSKAHGCFIATTFLFVFSSSTHNTTTSHHCASGITAAVVVVVVVVLVVVVVVVVV
jgi:hypothetical protein